MGSSGRAEMGRRALGPVGVFLPSNPGASLPPAQVQREAVRRLERAADPPESASIDLISKL